MSPISIKPSHRERLHATLGLPGDEPIPAAKLASAKKTAGPVEKKQIVFAQNSRRWQHK